MILIIKDGIGTVFFLCPPLSSYILEIDKERKEGKL